ncbi:beta galactosidase [Zychaea mexicana]|uniref:beta galactosidase n=1 Tax=Zychaea mexicana TaxID=64656 RepID=UPI0022FDF901|nr:beta galactosidase [Zychaea mexicana]KAI9494123.1 beta galactosidase [Zychaea mexicana]
MVFVKGVLTSISLAIAAVASVAARPAQLKFEKRQEDQQGIDDTSDNGLTERVTWDSYTLKLDGERVFLFSGEFHYFRLPSPDLWTDILQKFRALDYNGVSFYFNWGYHSPKKGVYNFDGVRDVQKAFDAAEEADLYVISRAGPYINAETDCGGFPSWLMDMRSPARYSNEEYNANRKEWLTEINKFLVPNQITNKKGGPIILNQLENEYTGHDAEYMEAIKQKFLADGIEVPSIFNDKGMNNYFVNGTGAPDIYGFDKYPAGFDCSNPKKWATNASTEYMDYYAITNPEQPSALWEFQGGAFDPWNGPGYSACRQMVNEQYAKIYYKSNYGQGVRIQNHYMTYGGISWGGLATPSVYTSYDYGAPISEPGLMTTKAYEVKLQATFLHTVKPFLATEYFEPKIDNSDNILVLGRASIEAPTKFYVAHHLNTPSDNLDEFHVTVNTTDGFFNIPKSSKLVLNGRDAKVLVADYDFESQHLVYSTSEIFTHQDVGSYDVIVVYAYEKEEGEFVIKTGGKRNVKVETNDSVTSEFSDGVLQLTYTHPNGTTPVYISGAGKKNKDLLVLISGYETALLWWAPVIDKKKDTRVLINGPYLVRSAYVSRSSVAFTGDIDQTTDIQVILPRAITSITWNGKKVKLHKGDHSIWTGTLKFTEPEVKYTDLTKAKWKYSPGSPETDSDFDDSEWTTADRLTTNSVTTSDTLPILYADDYGYHTGSIWFRGTFNGSSEITGFNLTCISGAASAWMVWLNGEYLGGFDVGSQEFRNLDINIKGKNVISALLWTTGHEEDGGSNDAYKTARGFTSAKLLGLNDDQNQTASIDWKIQGNLGGEDLADPVRGAYNEGGLYGERYGWHLPGFPDSKWEDASIPEEKSRTGVSWYRTTFDVDIPEGYDVPMSLRYVDETKTRYRSLLFLNGWQLGRYANDLGPQTQFYLPRGILNTSGLNTLAVAVIPIDEAAQIGKLILEPYKVLQSAIPSVDSVESPSYQDRQ